MSKGKHHDTTCGCEEGGKGKKCTKLPQPPSGLPVNLEGQNCVCCFEKKDFEFDFESNEENKPCQSYPKMCKDFAAPLNYPPIIDPSKLVLIPNPPLNVPLGQKIVFPPPVPNPLPLAGKVVLVIGASKGIGRATAERFQAEGADVFGTSRYPECYSDIPFNLLKLDTRNEDEVKSFFKHFVKEAAKQIDILVLCAAVTWRGPLAEATGDDLLNSINLDLVGYHRCVHYALPHMRHSNDTRIISLGSMAAYSLLGYAAGGYAISKIGLQKWNDVLQTEDLLKKAQGLVQFGPTFSLVEPYFVKTSIGLYEHFQASTIPPSDPLVRGSVFQQGVDQSLANRPVSTAAEAIVRIAVAPQPGARYAVIEPADAPQVFPLIQFSNTAAPNDVINLSNTQINAPRIASTQAAKAALSAAYGCQ